ncbi:MAG: hypothetical protein LZ173_10855 [Thaumarchaeota archaeon]|nr:hypothetical protein [Candidatus Geocrenenecus arthurdayi]
MQDHDKVEEIIVSRRILCGKKVAKILPQHYTAVRGPGDFCFEFTSEEELKHWIGVADAIWEEYIEVLREYYRIIGVKHYTLPEKPKWMFKKWHLHECEVEGLMLIEVSKGLN